MTTPDSDIFAGCRSLWLAGRCPCCGGALEDWPDFRDGEIVEPGAVAEGVMFCGQCFGERHYQVPGFLPVLLEALVTG